jgi:hypothetical protein
MFNKNNESIILQNRNSTYSYLETIILSATTSVNLKNSRNFSTKTPANLRTGYIFAFIVIFLIVLFGIVGRVIYSSNDPPTYIYEKYHRASKLASNYSQNITDNDVNNDEKKSKSKNKKKNKQKIEETVIV